MITIRLLIINPIVMENSKNNQHSAMSDEVKGDIRGLKAIVEDVLFSVNEFANETRQEFVKVRRDFAGLESRMTTKQDLADLESRMVTVDKMDLMETRLATRFVTKSYLDAKLADQTSEIFLRLNRRQDKDRGFKEKLIGVISGHSLITPRETNDLKELI